MTRTWAPPGARTTLGGEPRGSDPNKGPPRLTPVRQAGGPLEVARIACAHDGRGAEALTELGGSQARRVVLLRMTMLNRLRVAPEEDVDRVARVVRGLEPGELLAVRSYARPRLAEMRPRLGARDLRGVACSFAPDDHEVFLWRSPPEPLRAPAGPLGRTGLTLDVRALAPLLSVVVAVVAVARLSPGEVLVHISDRPPLLPVDLLAGRAVLDGVRVAGGGVHARLLRSRAASAREQPAGHSTRANSPGHEKDHVGETSHQSVRTSTRSRG